MVHHRFAKRKGRNVDRAVRFSAIARDSILAWAVYPLVLLVIYEPEAGRKPALVARPRSGGQDSGELKRDNRRLVKNENNAPASLGRGVLINDGPKASRTR